MLKLDQGLDAPPSLRNSAPLADYQAGLHHLCALGAEPTDAAAWLADTAVLASTAPGALACASVRQRVAQHPAPRREALDELRCAVYREVEALERRTRARLLLVVVRLLNRTAGEELEEAALDLISPLAPRAARTLASELLLEVRRPVSQALFGGGPVRTACGPRALPSTPEPRRVAGELTALAIGLDASLEARLEARLVGAESSFVFEGAEAGQRALDEATDGDAGERLRVLEDERGEDPLARLVVAIAMARRDHHRALQLLDSSPLIFDRSASLGTLRAVAGAQLQARTTPVSGGAALPAAIGRDEFGAQVRPEELGRITRFLGLVQRGRAEGGR